MQTIININGLDNANELVIGMVLVIPRQGVMKSFPYTVQSGDTLWSIGQKFNVNYLDIAKVNNLNYPYFLYIGGELQIPFKETVYTVKKGEVLWAIAQKYEISISQIIVLNDLSYPYIIYPGQELILDIIKPPIETLGYYIPSSIYDNGAIIKRYGKFLTYLGLFDFPMTESGDVAGVINNNILQASKEANVALLPVITNLRYGNFDRNLAYSVLSDEYKLNSFINNIIALLQKYNLIGVIIDIENLHPTDRTIFTRFIILLYEALKKNSKFLILNMPAKWESWDDKDWVGFFDYNALGAYIDRSAIMTYEFGWRSGPPRATVPINYIRRSLDYATANSIPASKILLGTTLYGYDWTLPDTTENLAKTVTLPEVWNLAAKHSGIIKFHKEEQQSYLNYIDDSNYLHKVWFENAKGHYLKYQLVREYNLKGVFYWLISQPFESTWYMVSQLFNIKKF